MRVVARGPGRKVPENVTVCLAPDVRGSVSGFGLGQRSITISNQSYQASACYYAINPVLQDHAASGDRKAIRQSDLRDRNRYA